jgi:hypothetical protein
MPWSDPGGLDVSRVRVAVIPTSNGWTPAPAVHRALDEAADSGAEVERWDDAPDLEAAVRPGARGAIRRRDTARRPRWSTPTSGRFPSPSSAWRPESSP